MHGRRSATGLGATGGGRRRIVRGASASALAIARATALATTTAFAAAMAGCVIVPPGSSSTGTGSAGAGGGTVGATSPTAPSAAVGVTDVADGADCAGTPRLAYGSDSAPLVDGETIGDGSTAHVTCRVAPHTGGGFDVSVSASATGGPTVASFDLTGTLVNDATRSQTASAVINLPNGEQAGGQCNLSFATTPAMGVSAGRVWGTVQCGAVGQPCGVVAEFQFENCAQQ